MELSSHQGFLEELLSQTWKNPSPTPLVNEEFTPTYNAWEEFNSFDEFHPNFPSSFLGQTQQEHEPIPDSSSFGYPPETVDFTNYHEFEHYPVKDEDIFPPGFEQLVQLPSSEEFPVFNNVAISGEGKSNSGKKSEGPSKNLMAERRRRKRLNDRLTMLRSIVPKITKMDRTSILGDTIDYMRELVERIKKLQEGDHPGEENQICRTRDESALKNSPKFDVKRGEEETRIEIRCGTRPGLLLSTVNTLEALGMEIQHCVISCFNDFSMQASCSSSEEAEQTLLSGEEIKQALLRSAGYGGNCLP